MAIWDDVLPEEDRQVMEATGWGLPRPRGKKPVLLVIDAMWTFTGDFDEPILDAIQRHRTACGEYAWASLPYVAETIAACREREIPIVYTVMDQRADGFDRFPGNRPFNPTAKKPTDLIGSYANGIPDVIAPADEDIVINKPKPSAFYGTPLVAYLNYLQADTVILTGCTTSGCIRSAAMDAAANNYQVLVPEEAVWERCQLTHKVNLFDIQMKIGRRHPDRRGHRLGALAAAASLRRPHAEQAPARAGGPARPADPRAGGRRGLIDGTEPRGVVVDGGPGARIGCGRLGSRPHHVQRDDAAVREHRRRDDDVRRAQRVVDAALAQPRPVGHGLRQPRTADLHVGGAARPDHDDDDHDGRARRGVRLGHPRRRRVPLQRPVPGERPRRRHRHRPPGVLRGRAHLLGRRARPPSRRRRLRGVERDLGGDLRVPGGADDPADPRMAPGRARRGDPGDDPRQRPLPRARRGRPHVAVRRDRARAPSVSSTCAPPTAPTASSGTSTRSSSTPTGAPPRRSWPSRTASTTGAAGSTPTASTASTSRSTRRSRSPATGSVSTSPTARPRAGAASTAHGRPPSGPVRSRSSSTSTAASRTTPAASRTSRS